LRFIQRGGIRNALAALFRRKGIDEQMCRADQVLVHGCRRLDGQPFIDQCLVETAAKLGQGFGQHKVGLRTAKLDVFDATGIHHRHVGTQPLTDRFIGGTHCVLQQFQRQEHTRWHGVATAGRTFGETPGNAVLDGLDHGSPGKGIRPLANGIGVGHDVGNPKAGAASTEPMLQVV
jgi:hypothetical protein